jgi:hypothetical protein
MAVRRALAYLSARIRERSTIASVAAALPTAVQLVAPWSWIVILAAIGVALLPTSTPNAPPSEGAAK